MPSIQDMVRALMLDIEERCGDKLPVKDPLFSWLLKRACDPLNWYMVRGDPNNIRVSKREALHGRYKYVYICISLYIYICARVWKPGYALFVWPGQWGSDERGGSTESGWDSDYRLENTWWPQLTEESSDRGRPHHVKTRQRYQRSC